MLRVQIQVHHASLLPLAAGVVENLVLLRVGRPEFKFSQATSVWTGKSPNPKDSAASSGKWPAPILQQHTGGQELSLLPPTVPAGDPPLLVAQTVFPPRPPPLFMEQTTLTCLSESLEADQ